MNNAISKSTDVNDFLLWFNSPGDVINSSLCLLTNLIILIYPIFVISLFYYHEKNGRSHSHLEQVFEGVNWNQQDNKVSTMAFVVFEYCQKILNSIVLLFLVEHMSFQIQIFTIGFIVTSCLIAHIRPYTSIS